MKVLLLNPPKERNGGYILREECAVGSEPTNVLPSQIYLAASYLCSRGWDADPVDARSVKASMAGYDVAVVWVSILHSYFDDLSFLREAKAHGLRTVMVLNDPHEGFERETLEKNGFIDAAVRLWERETTLEKLLVAWKRKEEPKIPGLVISRDGRILDTGTSLPLPNLKHLPSYGKLLENVRLEDYGVVMITPSRGCPTPCAFCLYRETRRRTREMTDVISELEVASTGIARAMIVDPAMMSDHGWTGDFCEALIKKRIPIEWRGDGRPEECKGEILQKMRRAGCDTILMGVESLEDSLRSKIRAGTTPEILDLSFRNLAKVGISPYPVFYIGYPWDSPLTLGKIRDFVKTHPCSFILKQVRPWRGTPLCDSFRMLGLLESEPQVEDYVYSDYPMCGTLFLSRDDLEEWKLRIARTGVFTPHYLLRYLRSGQMPTLLQLQLLTRIILGTKAWRKEALWRRAAS